MWWRTWLLYEIIDYKIKQNGSNLNLLIEGWINNKYLFWFEILSCLKALVQERVISYNYFELRVMHWKKDGKIQK